MASLARDLRKDLEKTVKQARRVAEIGARKVLEQLGVHHHEPYGFMSPEQRTLRNRLRAHGRQLGDRRDPQKGTQVIDRLVQECAYEHWHRMLFARFLAETDLLIEPQSGVAITLEECRELARDEGADWLELASGYAERMLPQIFRKDDPVLAVSLPPESRSELEDLLKALPRDVFTADDSLGWVYQFWQADAKEAVNKSGKKIGADELPAVTQLFTEDYMVLSLLHNTLGAWWAGKNLARNPELSAAARSEDEIRAVCKVGSIEWTYLRFIRDKDEDGLEGLWRPAAGVFDDWPKAAKDLTVLDPCMGSGHFLVFALPILVAFRVEEEGLSETEAIEAVLRDNLFGLEIDPRCTQIAAFNLAFAAWRRTGFHALPALNLACSGLAIGVTEAEWLKLAEKAVVAADPKAKRDLLGVEENLLTHGLEERVKNGLEALYDLFSKAPWLGSLIDPHRASADIFREGFDKLEPLLAAILAASDTDDAREMAVAAQGMAKAAEILSKRFFLIATNVPYLAKNKQDSRIQDFCGTHYPRSTTDLATIFLERLLIGTDPGGAIAIVSPRIWMTYTAYYESLRSHLLKSISFNSVSHLGKSAFETIGGEIVDVSLLIFSKKFRKDQTVSLLTVSDAETPSDKASALRQTSINSPPQSDFLLTPGSSIVGTFSSTSTLLSHYVECYEGLSRGDTDRFDRKFWELSRITDKKWAPLINSSTTDDVFSGADVIFLWEGGKGALSKTSSARIQGEPAWGRPAVFVSRTHLNACLTNGFKHAQNGVAIVPTEIENLLPVLLFCRSKVYKKEIVRLNQKLIKPTGVMDKTPFDLAHWKSLASKHFPDGVPDPRTSDPTQIYFSGNLPDASSTLQVAVARLVGYRWPRQTGFNLAGGGRENTEGLEEYEASDGIVCLPATRGQPPGADRLIMLLREAYGSEWSAAKLEFLLAQSGFAGSTLSDWLQNDFFMQHCTTFKHRPFVWHIWDGRHDGFNALINYHRLAAPGGEGRRTLEALIFVHLGDWIDRQRRDQREGIEGADARVAAAEQLKLNLEMILDGEPPYDIFTRWKPLSNQPIRWDPDIEDGVRVNIRPFMASPNDNTGASNLLRFRPKINWKKSKGKETAAQKEDYPWFYDWDEISVDWKGGSVLTGERHNDCHFSVSEKQSAKYEGPSL